MEVSKHEHYPLSVPDLAILHDCHTAKRL